MSSPVFSIQPKLWSSSRRNQAWAGTALSQKNEAAYFIMSSGSEVAFYAWWGDLMWICLTR